MKNLIDKCFMLMNTTESVIGILGVTIGLIMGAMFISFRVSELVAFSAVVGVIFVGLALVVKDLD